MDNATLTLQQLGTEMQTKDPFARAQQIQTSRQQPTPENIMNNPFQGLMDTQVPAGQLQTQEAPQGGSFSSAMNPIRILDQTSLMEALAGMGLDSSKLSFTPVGRMMLGQQMQSKFGTDYMKNRELSNLITSFDEVMKKNPITAAKQRNAQESSTKRILGFLAK